jgi:hypothetical protein
MEILYRLLIAVAAELCFALGFLLSCVIYTLVTTPFILLFYKVKIPVRTSWIRDAIQGLAIGFGACALALSVGLLISRSVGLSDTFIVPNVFLLPFLLEIRDTRERITRISTPTGCMLLNLHGAMKTPQQSSFFAYFRTAFAEQTPEISEDELFKASYLRTNLGLVRMAYGSVIGASLAVWWLVHSFNVRF